MSFFAQKPPQNCSPLKAVERTTKAREDEHTVYPCPKLLYEKSTQEINSYGATNESRADLTLT